MVSCYRRAPRSGFSSCWAILQYINHSINQSGWPVARKRLSIPPNLLDDAFVRVQSPSFQFARGLFRSSNFSPHLCGNYSKNVGKAPSIRGSGGHKVSEVWLKPDAASSQLSVSPVDGMPLPARRVNFEVLVQSSGLGTDGCSTATHQLWFNERARR